MAMALFAMQGEDSVGTLEAKILKGHYVHKIHKQKTKKAVKNSENVVEGIEEYLRVKQK
jgi:hypothetical protein